MLDAYHYLLCSILCELNLRKPTHSGTTVSTRPLKYREYIQSHLEQACKAVREGISVRRAAEEYQIPKSTIQDHISGSVKW